MVCHSNAWFLFVSVLFHASVTPNFKDGKLLYAHNWSKQVPMKVARKTAELVSLFNMLNSTRTSYSRPNRKGKFNGNLWGIIGVKRHGITGTVPEFWVLSGSVLVEAKYVRCPRFSYTYLGFHSLVSNLPFDKRARGAIALSFLTVPLRKTHKHSTRKASVLITSCYKFYKYRKNGSYPGYVALIIYDQTVVAFVRIFKVNN